MQLHVIQGDHGSLLSRKTATELGLLKVVNSMSTEMPISSPNQLLHEYQDIFQGISRFSSEATH